MQSIFKKALDLVVAQQKQATSEQLWKMLKTKHPQTFGLFEQIKTFYPKLNAEASRETLANSHLSIKGRAHPNPKGKTQFTHYNLFIQGNRGKVSVTLSSGQKTSDTELFAQLCEQATALGYIEISNGHDLAGDPSANIVKGKASFAATPKVTAKRSLAPV